MAAVTPRHNPFRTERTDAIPSVLQNTSWDELLARLEELQFRAAIIGKHGRGKTTLLSTLSVHLEKQEWNVYRLRLNASHRSLGRQQIREIGALGKRDFILLDGAEQLSTLRWRWFLHLARHAGGLVITSHRAGRLPTLVECRTSLALLKVLVEELAPEYSFDDETLKVLFERYDGNVREVLRVLYDGYATQNRCTK